MKIDWNEVKAVSLVVIANILLASSLIISVDKEKPVSTSFILFFSSLIIFYILGTIKDKK
jgi:hypothetical protein